MRFTIEIRDYESGGRDITIGRLGSVIVRMLHDDGSDGVVIVQQVPEIPVQP